MSDEVNFRAGNVKLVEPAPLGFELLHTIFAEERQACPCRLGQSLGGMHFGDAHKPHFPGRAASAMARRRDALFDVRQSFGERTHASMVGEAAGTLVPTVTLAVGELS